MNVVLLDPSLYTAPYDAGLTQGLLAAGVRPRWLTRPLRTGDRREIPAELNEEFFYRSTDRAARSKPGLRRVLKGCAHLAATVRLIAEVRRRRPDVVHIQWIVVPIVDAAAMAMIRRWCPVVLTVHDSIAYNGQKMAWLQRFGQRLGPRLADEVIVHTRSARDALCAAGLPREKISVVAHGPLRLAVNAAPAAAARDLRWTAVLFGEIKPYKGLDVLIEAVALLTPASRKRVRIVVAGRPRMDLRPHLARIEELGLHEQFELRLQRLTEEEMAGLFAEADAFVFPYRQIDASGVYYLAKPLGKWMIASRVGIFAEDVPEAAGQLVAPGDPPALARALERGVLERPVGRPVACASSWADIGRATRSVYERAAREFHGGREHPAAEVSRRAAEGSRR